MLATHYGGGPAWRDATDYNEGWLGCGLYADEDGDNRYSSWDPTIAATGYSSPWGCGDRLVLCGPAGCQAVIVQDTCPGCGPGVIDLSELAHQRVCGAGTCEVTAEVLP
jgi:expansin (peptidoglycan-binding protein)